MKSTPIKRRYLIAGGWILTAAAAFSFGRMTSWLDTPSTAPGSKAGGESSSGSNGVLGVAGNANDRNGGVFSSSEPGSAPRSIGEITQGQPLEDWLKKLLAQEDDLYRMQHFLKLVEALNSPEDIKTVLKALGGNGERGGRGGPGGFGGGRFLEYAMLMTKFTQLNPQEAMKFATEQEGGQKFMATSTALRAWAKSQPDAALEWAKTEGAKVQMDFGRGGPGGQGGPGNPANATGAQADRPQENFALMSVLSQMAKSDLDKAISTASTSEIGRMGGRMVDTLASEVIAQRGADEARKMVSSLPEGSFRDEFVQQLAGRLAEKDGAGTAKWVMEMPSSDAKRRALGQTIENWARTDVAAAGQYLAALPASADTDAARSEYVNQVSRQDPKAAWDWANTITDAERRARSLENVARDWIRTDAATAQPAIAQSAALPDDVKARLAREASRPQGGQGGRFQGGTGAGPTGGATGFRGGGGRGR